MPLGTPGDAKNVSSPSFDVSNSSSSLPRLPLALVALFLPDPPPRADRRDALHWKMLLLGRRFWLDPPFFSEWIGGEVRLGLDSLLAS